MSFDLELNLAITSPKEVAFIQEMIAPHEEQLLSLVKTITDQRDQLETNETTVKFLALLLDHATQLFEARKRDLAAHQREVSSLDELKRNLGDGDTRLEEYLEEMPSFANQITQKRADISKIDSKIREMRETIHARRFALKAGMEHLKALISYQESTKKTIQQLKSAFAAIHKIPAECWAIVFLHKVESDVEEYLKNPRGVSFPRTTLDLSQVCSFWRRVMHAEHNLWNWFFCFPSALYSPPQLARWKYFASFQPRNLTFLTDLEANMRVSTPVTEDGSAYKAMSSLGHSIHMICGNAPNSLAALAKLPFRGQLSVTIDLHGSTTVDLFDTVSTIFPDFSTLKITSAQRFPKMEPKLYMRTTPSTNILIMDLIEFDPFRIDYYCREHDLKELHVMQSGTCRLAASVGMSYSQLRILGITPPETVWFNAHKLPSLERLILYGPKLRTVDPPSLLNLSVHADFGKLKQLELQNWPHYEPSKGARWTIMSLVLQIADKLRFIETLRCTDSLIDGESLIALTKLLKGVTPAQVPSELKTVTIDRCTGITRRDCDLIAASVKKLVVYM